MRQNILLAAALSAATIASAQESNYTVDIGKLDRSLKNDMCAAEYNSCRVLCANSPTANDCNTETLEYECKCSNGSAPGLQYYIQTIPTFLCNQEYQLCIAANTQSSRAQDECKSDILSQCGTLDPTKADVSAPSDDSTTSAGSSPTNAPSGSGAANSPASTSTSTGGAVPTAAYIGNGVAMVAAGVFAAML